MEKYLVDTHAHLCDPSFDQDLDQVIFRARQHNIGAIIAVSENIDDIRKNFILSDQYPEVLPAAGLYPENADLSEAEKIRDLIRKEQANLVAIGEVGLDFRIAQNEQEKELQKEVFSIFIRLSLELDLPLNVHSRSAGKYAADLLLRHGASKVQMHAFDGKAGSAMEAVEAGYFFSVPPSISRSRQKQKLIKQLPMSCLLLETDSPVLGPSAEERNEPSNLLVSLKMISELKNVYQEEIRETVIDNTRRLYDHLFK